MYKHKKKKEIAHNCVMQTATVSILVCLHLVFPLMYKWKTWGIFILWIVSSFVT